MKTPPVSDLNSAAGCRRVAAWLDQQVADYQYAPCGATRGPKGFPTFRFGPFSLYDNPRSLGEAARLIRRNGGASREREARFDPDPSREGVRVYGSEVAAVAAIKRQLVQAPDMDPAAVNRARAACNKLQKGHRVRLHGLDPITFQLRGESAEIVHDETGIGDFVGQSRFGPASLFLTLSDLETLHRKGYILTH